MRPKDDPNPPTSQAAPAAQDTPSLTVSDAEADYHRARALVQDAMRRQDVAALEVAISLYRESLAAIRVAEAARIAAILSTAVDKASQAEASRGAA